MHPETFEQLIAAARQGAPWALQRIYEQYAGRVVSYARSRGSGDAEEVAGDTMLQALQGLDRFSGDEAAFRAWLFTIAHRRVIDARRRAGRRVETTAYEAEIDPRASASAEDEVLASQSRQRVEELLAGLSPDQREVLALRILGELTIPEIAELIGKREGAVKQLQRRGLAALARALEASAGGAPEKFFGDPYPSELRER